MDVGTQNEYSEQVEIEDVLSSRGRIKILKLLAKCNELNISAIARDTCLNHSLVKEHLRVLVRSGLVKEKKFGRILIYQYQSNNIIASALKKLFTLWESEKPLFNTKKERR